MKHVVVGRGASTHEVISEALRDVLADGDELMFPWVKPVPESLEAVYSYALDRSVPFTLLYTEGQSVPGLFREAEHGFVKKVRDPLQSMSSEVTGKVLFLWDDDNPDYINEVFDAFGEADVVELNNGLSPITYTETDEPPQPEVEEEAEEDDDATTFSKQELETMSAAVVKRYGQRMGCSSATKSGIIEELFPEEPAEESAPPIDEVPFVQELTTLLSNFYEHNKGGFEADMAHLALGQARLWMLKSLSQ